MKEFVHLNKLANGDQVAVISPSSGLPQLFPAVFELGLARLANEFGLTPKEYPTTRMMGAPLQDRARDVMAAFADPVNKAVFTSIGGDDQIKLLKYLDPQVLRQNPKPFVGFSDNTHLHTYLWNLGIPSYYGGAIMTQFGMHGAMDAMTVESIRQALFTGGEYEVVGSLQYNDVGVDWSDEAALATRRLYAPNDGLYWDGKGSVSGVLWGGCVESLIVQSTTGKYLPTADDLHDTILCIETAEDIPEPWIVAYLLTGFGERGWFDKFKAVLVGRPKAWEFDKQNTPEQKARYAQTQRETVLKTVREYNATIPVVQNLDFGHTDPQILVPLGRMARVDADAQRIFFDY